MIRRAIMVLVLLFGLALGAPVAAGAADGDTPSAAISDCNDHGQLTAHYSPATLRAALAQMPVDVREYTDCYDVIERQLFKELGQSTPGAAGTPASSSSGSGLPTWLLIVIVLLALAAVTFGALAVRRRTAPAEGPAGPAGGVPAEPGPSQPGDAPPQPRDAPPQPEDAPPQPEDAPSQPGDAPRRGPGGPAST
ncbi:MAG: hypothetical protein JOY56_15770 [Solirubrobacterales bacterium]|nr:hypothetical protein [Solirubrobacterales bacterium]